jgi:outer membrane protein
MKLKLFVLLAFVAFNANAQKLGYINFGNLLADLPEVAKADSLLRIYQDSLVTVGTAKGKAFEAEYKAYMELQQAGKIPPIEAKKKEADLQQKSQQMQSMQQEMQQMVEKKRGILLDPIIGKVKDAITAVGKENKYEMVFDVSSGAMMYASPSDDIMELVKKKLKM